MKIGHFISVSRVRLYRIFRGSQLDGSQLEIRCNRVKGRKANDAGYRSFRGLARGRKFRRKDAVGDEKPTGRRNLARRQPPRGSYNDLKIPPSILPPFFHPQRPSRSRWRVSGAFSFSVSFGIAHGGLDGAQLRLKTYDAVIFIAFRRLYAHLKFNAGASRAARANFVLFAETRAKTHVRLPSFFPFSIRSNGVTRREVTA